MSKLINGYHAEWISAEESDGTGLDRKGIGQKGQLTVWESEHRHPGQKYVRFAAEDDFSYVVTSCGEVSVSGERFTICTHGGEHIYTFRLTGGEMRLPKRYWHICDTCGKREFLSSREAFEQGWAYPGPDGAYRHDTWYGFSANVPRMCKSCSGSGRMNGWLQYYGDIMMIFEDVSEEDMVKELDKAQQAIDWMQKTKNERAKRVFLEPWSLLTEEAETD